MPPSSPDLRVHHLDHTNNIHHLPTNCWKDKSEKDDNIDLQAFDFPSISNATNQFSESNKLGQGGFGPVYKAWRLWIQQRPMQLMDDLADNSAGLSEILRHIHIGLLCVQQRPEDRPNMSSVVLMLNGEKLLPQPSQPGFYTGNNHPPMRESSPRNLEAFSFSEMSNSVLVGLLPQHPPGPPTTTQTTLLSLTHRHFEGCEAVVDQFAVSGSLAVDINGTGGDENNFLSEGVELLTCSQIIPNLPYANLPSS
ncbi:hypothetical protein JHK85_016953 [Glycine max]|nr:hypothetical protein JHK85_016953 [Glycine max]